MVKDYTKIYGSKAKKGKLITPEPVNIVAPKEVSKTEIIESAVSFTRGPDARYGQYICKKCHAVDSLPNLESNVFSNKIVWIVLAIVLLTVIDSSLILFLLIAWLVYRFSSAEKKAKYKAIFFKLKNQGKDIMLDASGIKNCKKCHSTNSMVKLDSKEGQEIKNFAKQ